jgi:hypothetical protein
MSNTIFYVNIEIKIKVGNLINNITCIKEERKQGRGHWPRGQCTWKIAEAKQRSQW